MNILVGKFPNSATFLCLEIQINQIIKRKNPTSILYYREKGFLLRLLNYLGRMGWSMPDEREKFTLAEMLDVFDIQRISWWTSF